VVGAAGLGLVAGCGRLPWQGQPAAERSHRIGYLATGNPRQVILDEAFRQGLRERGYVEGQNVILEYRTARTPEQAAAAVAELIALPVEVILAGGTVHTVAAQAATSTIPIVVTVSTGPVEGAVVTSLARPSGSTTGLSTLAPGLAGKRLQLLYEAVPAISRVAILWNPDAAGKPVEFQETEQAARILGLQTLSFEVRRDEAFPQAFAAIAAAEVDALFVINETVTLAHIPDTVEFATSHRLPSMFETREWIEAGGLLNYGADRADLWRRAAYYVDRILKGAKPADLPVEQPTTFEFVVNMKTAQALGITFPNEIMLQVTEVIQ
jgi:putative tryptophan/tyrosine transport system substrate-binding protein